jgi:alkanesulfonate monooxygenase SsuD/methylene tetrahydromethanopterin reductase-like flavin-dependent oxidoreductase (luciferase family)
MTGAGTIPVAPAQAAHPWVAAGAGQVRFGIAYGPRTDWPACHDFVQEVEGLGYDSYWAMDQPVSGFDCWSSLAALAAATTRLRLGPLVSCVYYRSPAQLARLAADVDRISGGRLVIGLGMGNHEREFAKLGIPFPDAAARLRAVEETVLVVRGLWDDAPLTHDGPLGRLAGANVRPGPAQLPRIPLLIAGGGERVTLRQVAQYADAANFSPHSKAGSAFTADDVGRKLAALRRHCDDLGRDDATILRTQVTVPVVLAETRAALATKLAAIPPHILAGYQSSLIAGTPDNLVAYYRPLIDAGLNYFMAGIYGDDRETVRLLAREVVPALAPRQLPTPAGAVDICGGNERAGRRGGVGPPGRIGAALSSLRAGRGADAG